MTKAALPRFAPARAAVVGKTLFAAALLTLALAGCGGSGGDTEGTPDPKVRALNLSPGTTLDVTIDDGTPLQDVEYLSEKFPSVSRDADTYDFGIRESGSTVDLDAEGYDLQTGADYVYAAIGLVNFGEENSKRLRGTLIGYDRRSPGETKARVIAVNAALPATGTEPSPIVFEAPGDSPQFTFGAVEFAGSAVQVLDAGPQTIEVRTDGAEATLATVTVSLLPGRTYVAAYSGREGGTGTSAPAIRFLLVP